jgi:hypothetical protein
VVDVLAFLPTRGTMVIIDRLDVDVDEEAIVVDS